MGTIDILAGQLLSPDEEIRRQATLQLKVCPFADVRNHILGALADDSWRVRKEAVDALLAGPVDEEAIESLICMLGANDNAGLRNSAVEALERLGNLAVSALCRHTTVDDHDVRKFVVDILGSIGDAAAVPLLIDALDDADPNVSAAAAENLGKIGDARALPSLVQALGKNDLWLRYTILEALSRIGKPVEMVMLSSLAGENLLKKALFDCLGTIGNEEAVPLLLEGLGEKAKNAREAAVVALMKVRERLQGDDRQRLVDLPLARLNGSPMVECLIASLDTSDRLLQEALVHALGLVDDGRAVPALLSLCRDERLRRPCLTALKQMGATTATALMESFPSADDEDRCFIAYLCGELHLGESVNLLRDGLHGNKALLRKTSALAVGKIGASELIDDLVGLLEDRLPEVRDAAISALAKLAENARDAVLEVAAALSGAKSHEKRLSAAWVLAALGEAEKLSLLLKDEEAAVRKAAANSLSALKNSGNIPHLVMALADEDIDVRIAVAAAMGEIGTEEVLDPLLLALQDEDLWVRCAALKSLGKLRDARALAKVIEISRSAQGLELISALECLAGIGGEQVLPLVKESLENPDEEVVKAAIQILAQDRSGWIEQFEEQLLCHHHWDVRRSFVAALAEQKGMAAVPRLRLALATETDGLVKETIAAAMDRLQ